MTNDQTKIQELMKGATWHDIKALAPKQLALTWEETKKLLREAVSYGRETLIKDIFNLEMHDSFGYGNSTIYLSDLEKVAEKYGYSREKILALLSTLTK